MLRVLIADDHAIVRKGLKEILREASESTLVGEASNGDEALARVEAEPWDVVVLLDLKMPKVNGLDVLKQMKADEQLRLVPVVMLTSSREERDLVASYQLGVNAYVVKPVSFGEFVSAIQNLGVFWALVNEPPPDAGANGASKPVAAAA